MSPSLIDLTGRRFGRLVITGRSPSKKGHTHWAAACDCWKQSNPAAHNLGHKDRSRRIVSCGCYHREVASIANITHGLSKTLRFRMWCESKKRAKVRGILFSLRLEDIPTVPEHCPYLGIPLIVGIKQQVPSSPSLDRIDSALGYIPGNVQIISNKANTMKHTATFSEFERMYLNWRATL